MLYVPSLIVPGDVAATAIDLVAHESLFRLGIVSGLVCHVIFVFVAARPQLSVQTRVADLRTLSEAWPEQFAAVLACDNVLPHLLTDAEIACALADCRRCLRPGGAFIASVRDYAAITRVSPEVRPYGSRTGFTRTERRDGVFFQPLVLGVAA